MTVRTQFLVDTNVLIRLMVQEPAEHAKAARELFKRAKAGDVHLTVPFTAVSEAVFTLSSFYRIARRDVADALLGILKSAGVGTTAPDWVFLALESFGQQKLSFGDACIAAEAAFLGMAVASFDADFDNIMGVERYEPSKR